MKTTTAQPTRPASVPIAARRSPGATVVVVVAAAVVAAVIAVRLAPLGIVVVAALVPLARAALVDAVERRLPDRLVLVAAVPAAVVCAADPFVGRLTAVGAVVAGALLLALPLLTIHLIAPRAMGFGDVKAAASLGATLGLIRPELSLWTLCLASAVAASWGLLRRSRYVAFGPALVLGAVAVLVVGASTGLEVAAWR